MTYLAVPISGKDEVQARMQIGNALTGGAEMLELRTDYIQGLTAGRVRSLLSEVRQMADVPIIVTCRDWREGGATEYPESLRIDVLLEALVAGADFVDLEFATHGKPDIGKRIGTALIKSPKSKLILSAHDFARPFDDLKALHRRMVAACPGAIPKLVYAANHINDCFPAFDLLHETNGQLVVLCMGQAGLIGRILAKKLGGLITFASLDEGAATAPGQLTLAQFKGLYRHDSIDAKTELFGVIADPVGHSLSPAIHNACFADMKMNRLYLQLLVQGGRVGLFRFLDGVLARPWLDFRGFSVTIPHKHDALEYVRAKGGSIEPLAEKIGAANTLVIGPAGNLSAYNTDYAGALDAITEGMGTDRKALRDMPVAVVGAGGVARAIVAGLTDAGAKVTIYNRTVERAKELASDFLCDYASLDALPRLDAKLLVNCTSIGMYPKVDATPVPPEAVKPDMAVFDTVYNPAETLLLKQAEEVGANAIDGISMFVNQAAAQFRLFTGREADRTLIRRVALVSPLFEKYGAVIRDHRRWLDSFDEGYATKWERLLSPKADPEAAICEAATRQFLEMQGTVVEPKESLSAGGPDYLCKKGDEHFFVEVTCISRQAGEKKSGLVDHPSGGPPDYAYLTKKICDEIRTKTPQCSGLDGPCLVVVCTLHAQADILFDDLAAEELLAGIPCYSALIDTRTGDVLKGPYDATRLEASLFVRPTGTPENTVEFASSPISGVLLYGLGAASPSVEGVLHPNPRHAFDRTLLMGVRFARLVEDCWRTGRFEVEWI